METTKQTIHPVVTELFKAFTIESIPDPVIALDTQYTILFMNAAACTLYGYSAEEVVGKSERSIMKTRVLGTTQDEVKKILRTKGIWSGEAVQADKFGRRIFISSTVKAAKDTSGKVIGLIAISHDITAQKQIEYNLRFLSSAANTLSSSLDYNTTLRRVAELAITRIADWCSIDLLNTEGHPELVALKHRDPKKVKWAEQLRARSPIDMTQTTGVPKVLKTGIPEFYPYIPEEMLTRIAENPKQLALLKKIGFTAIIIVPIFENDYERTKPIGAITFVSAESRRQYVDTDLVTAQKLASRASIAMQNVKLYKHAEDEIRRHKATQEKLEAREQELDAILKNKDNFISIASHELKTPITTLQIYIDLLTKQLASHGEIKFFTTIDMMQGQIKKITRLVSDLLNLTKMQNGKIEFEMKKFNISDVVVHIVKELTPTLTHTISISGKSSKLILGDKEKMSQVLTNLITNAAKYSPKQKKIDIIIKQLKNTIKISITDYGIGIEKKHQEKIFDRFYQVSNQKDTFPGLGLGLYISEEIIKQHHGTIFVESKKNKGSVFTIELPIVT